MSYGNHKFYVAHAFATHFLFRNLHTATVADNAFVANTLVFSAMTFKVFYRTEDALTEKSVALRLVGAVVYSFGL